MNKNILLALALFMPAAAGVHGAVVGVDWGGPSMVTTSQPLNLGTAVDIGTDNRTWSQTETAFTPGAPAYTGQPVYGYLQNRSGTSSPQNLSAAEVTNVTSPGDRLAVSGVAKDPDAETWGARSITGLLYFAKKDFLGGLDAAPALRFADDGGMSLTISGFNGGGSGSSRVVRMAVLNDGQWYLSWSYRSTTTTFTIDDLNTEKWAPYPIVEGELLPLTSFNESNYNYLGSSFDQIEAIGFYFTNSFAANNTVVGAPTFHFNAFSASFAPIPEPSTALLLFPAGLLIGATAWARRSKVS